MTTLLKSPRTSSKFGFSFGKQTETCTDLVVQKNDDKKLLTVLTQAIENSKPLPPSPKGASSKPSGTDESLKVSYAGGRAWPSQIREAMTRSIGHYDYSSWSSATWHTHVIGQERNLRIILSGMVCSCGHPAWSHKDHTRKCAGCHSDGNWAGTSYGGHDNCKCKGFALDYRKSFPTANLQAKTAIELHRDIAYLEGVLSGSINPLEVDQAHLKEARENLSKLTKKAMLTPSKPNKMSHRSNDIFRARESVNYWLDKTKTHYYATDSIRNTLALVKPIAEVITPAGFDFGLDTSSVIIEEVVEQITALEVTVDVRFPESMEEFMLTLGTRRSFTELTMQEHFDLFQWQTRPEQKAASGRALNECTRRDAELQALKAISALEGSDTDTDSRLLVEGMTISQWISAMPKVALTGRQKALAVAAPGAPLLMTAVHFLV